MLITKYVASRVQTIIKNGHDNGVLKKEYFDEMSIILEIAVKNNPSDADTKRLKEAFEALQMAASLGSLISPPIANFFFGFCFANGLGVGKNEKNAVEFYRLAADQGYAPAQNNLGFCYDNGKGVEKDQKRAAELYRLAAEQRYAPAQCNLGSCYDNGKGVEKDQKRAIELYQLAANQGYAPAQFNLGSCYDNGEGVEKDEKRAVELYQLAANQGYVPAQVNLALSYSDGEGVEKDEKRAVELYQLAADQGNAQAQSNLGCRYQYGEGVEKDEKRAIALYQLAAEQGYSIAQCNLGRCYEDGEGVEKDEKRAVELYQLAANQGYARAQCHLADCYMIGRGIGKDEKRAIELYQLAAEQGDYIAKVALQNKDSWCRPRVALALEKNKLEMLDCLWTGSKEDPLWEVGKIQWALDNHHISLAKRLWETIPKVREHIIFWGGRALDVLLSLYRKDRNLQSLDLQETMDSFLEIPKIETLREKAYLFHFAAIRGKLELIKKLFEQDKNLGVNSASFSSIYLSTIQSAATAGQLDMVDLLLKKVIVKNNIAKSIKLGKNKSSKLGIHALIAAVNSSQVEMATYLLRNFPNIIEYLEPDNRNRLVRRLISHTFKKDQPVIAYAIIKFYLGKKIKQQDKDSEEKFLREAAILSGEKLLRYQSTQESLQGIYEIFNTLNFPNVLRDMILEQAGLLLPNIARKMSMCAQPLRAKEQPPASQQFLPAQCSSSSDLSQSPARSLLFSSARQLVPLSSLPLPSAQSSAGDLSGQAVIPQAPVLPAVQLDPSSSSSVAGVDRRARRQNKWKRFAMQVAWQ